MHTCVCDGYSVAHTQRGLRGEGGVKVNTLLEIVTGQTCTYVHVICLLI